jgi:ArsR family transcriptional regulator, zinc-responsive transcriptional repressor
MLMHPEAATGVAARPGAGRPGTGPKAGTGLGSRSADRSDPGAVAAAGELLRALGAPHRLAIVLELADSPRCVHELVERLGISQSLTSQHLRVLRTAGLVVGTRRGKETAYVLADEHVAHIALDALAHSTEPAGPARLTNTETTEHEEHMP